MPRRPLRAPWPSLLRRRDRAEPEQGCRPLAAVSVTAADVPLATKRLKIGPSRRVVLQLPVTLTQLGTTQLTVTVTPASPIETTLKNNTRGLAVETTEFRVQESATLGPELRGLRRAVQSPRVRRDQPCGRCHRRKREGHGTEDARSPSPVLADLLQQHGVHRSGSPAVVHPHGAARSAHRERRST